MRTRPAPAAGRGRGKGRGAEAPVRVLLTIHAFPPHLGGMESVVEVQAVSLAEAGFDVTVLTSDWGAKRGRDTTRGYAIVRCRALNLFERTFGVPFPLFGPMLLWHAWTQVRAAEVVHINDVFYQSSLVVGAFARLQRKPLVLTQHVGYIPHPSRLVQAIQVLVYRTYGQALLRSAAKVIVLNSRVASFVQGLVDRRLDVEFVPNPVDLDEFRPLVGPRGAMREEFGLTGDLPIVLFAGRLVPKKGFDVVLRAKAAGYLLAVAGEPVPADVNGTAAGSDADGIRYLGRVAHEEMARLYQVADVLVLPSTGEGFPVTVQEAMASGLSVVTTDDPSYLAYQLPPSAICLVEPTSATVRTAVDALVAAGDERGRMGGEARRYAERVFSVAAHVARMEEIYAAVTRVA